MEPEIYVYSAITGSYDSPPTVRRRDPTVRYVLICEQDVRCAEPWELVHLERAFDDDKVNNGYYKCRPDLIFGHEAVVVWVDGCLKDLALTRQDILELVSQEPVAALPHGMRSSVAEEQREVIEAKLESPHKVNYCGRWLEAIGYPDNLGLAATMLVVRDLRQPLVRAFCKTWWHFVALGARRDQLSFNPALWLHGICWRKIDVDWREPNRFFTRVDHIQAPGRILDGQTGRPALEHSGCVAKPRRVGIAEDYPEMPWYLDENWGSSAIKALHAINATVVKSGEKLEGNYCHFHLSMVDWATPPDPRRAWKREILRRSVIGAACGIEIGFNAGHSAVIMLDANKELRLVAVDIGSHSYAAPCAQVVEQLYPGRMQVRWGPSNVILPKLDRQQISEFDFVHIDGGHEIVTALADFKWFIREARLGCILIVDDAYAASINWMVKWAREGALLDNLFVGLPGSGENSVFIKRRNLREGEIEKLEQALGQALERAQMQDRQADECRQAREELSRVLASRSWRLTAPLRHLAHTVRSWRRPVEP